MLWLKKNTTMGDGDAGVPMAEEKEGNSSMGPLIDLNIPLCNLENKFDIGNDKCHENTVEGGIDRQRDEQVDYIRTDKEVKDWLKGRTLLAPPYDYNESNKRKRKRKGGRETNAKGKSLVKGRQVKEAGEVLKVRRTRTTRRPNVNCRVRAFGRICATFDDLRMRWVREMGFGGLLHLAGKQLPRTMCYWLMTRIDPTSEMLCVGEREYRLSPNQVRWVLGLPKGEHIVPHHCMLDYHRVMVQEFSKKYCGVWTTIDRRTGKAVCRKGFSVTPTIVAKLEEEWQEADAEEFKTLFLMCALVMVLCPTQSWRLSPDLIPALACATYAKKYNWCALVLNKLMLSVCRFARTFNKYGFAGGCGGCTLFIAVFYLDKLARNPILWGIRPRVKVWTTEEIRKACREDKWSGNGDYGATGVVDVAYGDPHPREARDSNIMSDVD